MTTSHLCGTVSRRKSEAVTLACRGAAPSGLAQPRYHRTTIKPASSLPLATTVLLTLPAFSFILSRCPFAPATPGSLFSPNIPLVPLAVPNHLPLGHVLSSALCKRSTNGLAQNGSMYNVPRHLDGDVVISYSDGPGREAF
jgi:hypothetical protein